LYIQPTLKRVLINSIINISTLKIARIIADLGGVEKIAPHYICKAIEYCSMDRTLL